MSETQDKYDKRFCRHDPSRKCDESCIYRRMLAIIGKRYTLSILRNLMYEEKMRFNELAKEVAGSPKTLTERLNELVELQIIHREAFAEIPPRVEYSLTAQGRDLKPVMEAIRIWVEKWWLDSKLFPYAVKHS